MSKVTEYLSMPPAGLWVPNGHSTYGREGQSCCKCPCPVLCTGVFLFSWGSIFPSCTGEVMQVMSTALFCIISMGHHCPSDPAGFSTWLTPSRIPQRVLDPRWDPWARRSTTIQHTILRLTCKYFHGDMHVSPAELQPLLFGGGFAFLFYLFMSVFILHPATVLVLNFCL